MRSFCLLLSLAYLVMACDDERVYEKNQEFTDEQWLASDKPSFEFVIPDAGAKYNLYFNVRNEVSYPKANLYFTYHLKDSTGRELQSKLMSQFLFDRKTGEPFGSSGIGDVYDHQVPIMNNHAFEYAGRYNISFEQFMRLDTLPGVIAIGLRVERAALPKK